jgi:hypothetical protein
MIVLAVNYQSLNNCLISSADILYTDISASPANAYFAVI